MVKTRGQPLAALAVIVVDNPMVAATGHRICNDCMKACIYQKQEPVNIPQAETRTLKDVLELPWGFEIYSLLTRWNPLNLRRPLPLPDSGRKVLVVGLGPAGFTLAHHLMNDGHARGRHRRPQDRAAARASPAWRCGRACRRADARLPRAARRARHGRLRRRRRIRHHGALGQELPQASIRLLLERRGEFAMFGGVRFGGTLTLEDACAMGFDHVALCVGAGKPTVLDIPNGLARGVRAASDFLMALQLTGAAKEDSIANMQLRLPVVVIGGGLTAIDTATESLAYYVVQVEKFLARYETLAREIGEDAVRDSWDDQEREIAEEFLAHARAIRDERSDAAREERAPRIVELLQPLGRRHHRLPPAPDRQPLLHAEPRGSGKGARGRHLVRRRPRAAGGGRGQLRRGARHPPQEAPSDKEHWLPGAHGVRRRRHAAEHRARARGCGALRARRQVLRGLRRGRQAGEAAVFDLEARHAAGAAVAGRPTAASSATSATCTRPISATS